MGRNAVSVYFARFGRIDLAAEAVAELAARCKAGRGGDGSGCGECPLSGSIWGCDDAGTAYEWLRSEAAANGR